MPPKKKVTRREVAKKTARKREGKLTKSSPSEHPLKCRLLQTFKMNHERLEELATTYELSLSGIGLIKARPENRQTHL